MIESINDLELQKLKKERPSLTVAAVKEFDDRLVGFSKCTRYPLLAAVPLSAFLDQGSAESPLAGLSIGELVECGTYEICVKFHIAGETLEQLTKLFKNLADDADLNAPRMEDFEVSSYVPPGIECPDTHYTPSVSEENLNSEESSDTHVKFKTGQGQIKRKLNSIEEERKLSEGFRRLRGAPQFTKIRSLIVGNYWDSEAGRAPFIEAMTFGQLVEIKIAHLLEKRSFTERKTHGILDAINKCLEEYGFTEKESEDENCVPGESVSGSNCQAAPEWQVSDLSLPALAQTIIGFFESQCSRSQTGQGGLKTVVEQIPQVLSRPQFVILWLGVDYEPELVADLMKVSLDDITAVQHKAGAILADRLREQQVPMTEHWETALAGPGIDESHLIAPYLTNDLDSDFQRTFSRMILKVLGGGHPQAFSRVFSDYWTKKSESLDLILENIIAGMPKTQEQLQQEFSAFLPFFKKEDLTEVLDDQIYFEQKKKVWKKRSKTAKKA
jgi:hypothetical protein